MARVQKSALASRAFGIGSHCGTSAKIDGVMEATEALSRRVEALERRAP